MRHTRLVFRVLHFCAVENVLSYYSCGLAAGHTMFCTDVHHSNVGATVGVITIYTFPIDTLKHNQFGLTLPAQLLVLPSLVLALGVV